MTLVDDTNTAITVTLWGDRAEAPAVSFDGKVVAFKGAKLSDYGGRSLSTYQSTQVDFEPDLPETHRLVEWWRTSGSSSAVMSLTSTGQGGQAGSGPIDHIELRKTLVQIKNEGLGSTDRVSCTRTVTLQGDIIHTKAEIIYAFHSPDKAPWYPACPNMAAANPGEESKACNKKLVETAGRGWMCERCQQFVKPEHRFILLVNLADSTGVQAVTFFNEEAKQLLGHSADELHAMLTAAGGQSAEYDQVFQASYFREYIFTLRAKVRPPVARPHRWTRWVTSAASRSRPCACDPSSRCARRARCSPPSRRFPSERASCARVWPPERCSSSERTAGTAKCIMQPRLIH